jgi:hypothetical protein
MVSQNITIAPKKIQVSHIPSIAQTPKLKTLISAKISQNNFIDMTAQTLPWRAWETRFSQASHTGCNR